ncbi:MAG: SurA N-terminal domain-containing protein [Gemmatimonadota bacterium]
MRDNMKWIMVAVAIAFVGLMVFGWGMDITGRTSSATTGGEMGRVNGEVISYQEWLGTYRNLYDQQQRQNPGQPVGAALNRQIENSAWDQLVMQRLVNQELRRRGIEVTESEIRQAARFAPPPEMMDNEVFKTNGQFDINKYHQFLASPSIDPNLLLQLEAYYRDVIPRSKLFYQVTSGAYMTEAQLWRIWRDARETVKVRYIAIDPEVVVADGSVTVRPDEIKDYYDEHQDEFKRPASARVRYVAIDRAPTAPDSAAALQRARAVRAAAITNFEEAAKQSADSLSARTGGELGKMRRGQTVPAFEQAVYALSIGQVSEPVLTQFGYHIIRVDARTDEDYEARHILIPITRSAENEGALLERADSLENLAQHQSLERAAQRLGLNMRNGELNDSTPYLPVIGPADDAAQWIFRDAEVGETSDVFETPNAYYIVELLSRMDAGITSLSDARAQIEQKLKTKKKLERAKEFGRTVVERIRSGASLDQAAAQYNLRVAEAGPFSRLEFVPGLGRANAVVGTAFGQKPDQISGIAEAEGMLFIVQTLEKQEADRAEFEAQKTATRARMTQALAEQRWNEFLAALKENAKIIDNRDELRRQQQELAQNPNATSPLGF